MSWFEWILAFRFLRTKRKEGFISVIAGFSFLGIALGVATLIVVMAVMNGFRTELTKRILGINAHISLYSTDDNFADYEAVRDKIMAIEGVTEAAPLVVGQVLASANERHAGVMVYGLKPRDMERRPILKDNLVVGNINTLNEVRYGVILGSKLAQNLRVMPGDKVQFISPNGTRTIAGNMPRMKEFVVRGIVEVGMYEYDSSAAYIHFEDAQLYFRQNNPSSASVIDVMVEDYNQVEMMRSRIAQQVGPAYYMNDWKQTNSHFFNSLKVERNVMFLILSLIIAVAAFNIVGGMVMMVTDKTKDIAILRTMGARRAQIMRSFIISGSLIGVVGTMLGVALGLGFAMNIEEIRQWLESLTDTELFAEEVYFLSQLPADVRLENVVNIVLMAFGLSFLATIYPAYRASSITPIEGVSRG